MSLPFFKKKKEEAERKIQEMLVEGGKLAEQILQQSKEDAKRITDEAELFLKRSNEKIVKQKEKLQNEIREFQEKKKEELSILEQQIKEAEAKSKAYQEKLETQQSEQNKLAIRKDQLYQEELTLHKKEATLRERKAEIKHKSRTLDARQKEIVEKEEELMALEKQLIDQEGRLKKIKEEASVSSIKPQLKEAVEVASTSKKNQNMSQELDSNKLPNAMVGKAYRHQLNLQSITQKEVLIREVVGLEALGLEYDVESSIISGCPNIEGEKTIYFRFKFRGDIETKSGSLREKKFHILILPDPKSLWKNIDPPLDGLFYKANEDAMYIRAGEINILGASIRGRSHAHEGTFRDDHFIIEELGNGWQFLATADGAGSAKFSREGSKIACEVSRSYIRENLSASKLEDLIPICHTDNSKQVDLKNELYGLFGNAIIQSRNELIRRAKEHEHSLKDYASTLILALVKEYHFGTFIASYWVGDGAVAIYRGKQVSLLGTPDGGEFAGQTRFLTMSEITTSEDIFNRIQFQFCDQLEAFFLMTDGVSDPKFQTDSNLKDVVFWHNLWADINDTVQLKTNESPEKTLLEWLKFWSQGNHDDRTIIILYK